MASSPSGLGGRGGFSTGPRIEDRVEVAIVRRRAHLERACLLADRAGTHFVCLSLDAFAHGLERGLSVTIPSDYEAVRDHDFSIEGNILATEWLRKRLTRTLSLSHELETCLATRCTFFFATALFTLELVHAVVKAHGPRKVYLWRDEQRAIIGDWPPGIGEGSVFAEVAAEWLAERGIAVEFIDAEASAASRTTSGQRLRRYLGQSLPQPITSILRSLYRANSRISRKSKCLYMRGHLALGGWRQIAGRRPTILLWGAHVDGVYQAELEHHWRKERHWRILRIESRDPSALAARARARNATLSLGWPMDLAIEAFVPPPCAMGEPQTGQHELACLPPGQADVGPILRNRALEYQYQAMVREARMLQESIRSLCVLLSRISPDCVVTHLDSSLAIAARQTGIPSVSVAHGGIFFPELLSMHGDVNVVSGDVQRRFCERFRAGSGQLVAAGLPHVPPAEHRTEALRRGACSIASVVFLVTDSDYYCWDTTNLRVYLEALARLRDLAVAGHFNLTVKLHPRYGQASLYTTLMKADGRRVRLEMTPSLGRILEQADIAVVSGLTTAIIEALEHEVPVVAFFHHSQPRMTETPYHQILRDVLPNASNTEELARILLELTSSRSSRAAAARRQKAILPDLLLASGSNSARRVAQICQDLIDRRREARPTPTASAS